MGDTFDERYDLDGFRKLAEAVLKKHPGRWVQYGMPVSYNSESMVNGWIKGGILGDHEEAAETSWLAADREMAEYISAVDPEVVLALLDRIEAFRPTPERMSAAEHRTRDWMTQAYDAMAERDRLKNTVEDLEALVASLKEQRAELALLIAEARKGKGGEG